MTVTPRPRPPREFELSGGSLCLDFANTWADRERPEKEYLRSYGDLVDFSQQAEIVTSAIYRLFSGLAAGEPPPEEDLERLNAALPEALAGLRVQPRTEDSRATGGGEPRPYPRSGSSGLRFTWTRSDAADSLTAPLRPIARSAAELLTSDLFDRVRECRGDDCTWLFLDQSRNRSRRWCSMESCGNRAKVRRHDRRQRRSKG
jgi:predicted RNA-binding Zn ribbon-like protein